MRKARYTTPETIEADARAWMSAVSRHVRREGAGGLDSAALVVLDAQRWFLDPEGPAFLPAAPAIQDNLRRLAGAFRGAGLTVVFTRHSDPPGKEGDAMEAWWGRRMERGSPWFELAPGCGHEAGDALVDKSSYSAFRDTGLKELLLGRSVETVVLAGVQTHLCVETTARDAFQEGFAPVVVSDATAAPDLDLHLGSLRGMGHGIARIADTRGILVGLGSPAPPKRLTPADTDHYHDLLVIGAGPAGIAAAIQAHRMGVDTLLLERDRPGGLVGAALLVENYPGFPAGIGGSWLSSRFVAQARDLGVRIASGEATGIEEADGRLEVTLADGRVLGSRAVITATGTRPVRLGVPGEDGSGSGPLHYRVDRLEGHARGEKAVVVGSGDCALDQALHLWHMGYRVSVLVRGSATKAIGLLSERTASAGIEVRTGCSVTGLGRRGDETVLSIDGPSGPEEATADVVLVAVGRGPVAPAMPAGLLVPGPESVDDLGRTDAPGLYLAGDCRRGWIRQTAVAVGDGVASAMDAARYLEEGKWK